MKIQTTGTKELQAKIDSIIQKQLPFAASVALNKTATEVKKGVDRQLVQDIDRPTPFTKKAIAIEYSKKTRLTAAVYVRPIQAQYLKYQILGGKRTATRKAPILIASTQTKKNKYGNLARGKVKKLNNKGKVEKVGNLLLEVKRRNKSKADARVGLAYQAKSASYKPRFKFYERAKRVATQTFEKNMQQALANAIKTAK